MIYSCDICDALEVVTCRAYIVHLFKFAIDHCAPHENRFLLLCVFLFYFIFSMRVQSHAEQANKAHVKMNEFLPVINHRVSVCSVSYAGWQ